MPAERAPGKFDAADNDTPASFDVMTTDVTEDPVVLLVNGLTMVAELTGITCLIDLVGDVTATFDDAVDTRTIDIGILGPPVVVDVTDVELRIKGRTIGTDFFGSPILLPGCKQ